MIRKRRGISPVIAIVILIAVAVALGIAVAFWATGLIGTLGKVEKLEIRTAYAESVNNASLNGWAIHMSGSNTGTADITIVEITINGKPLSSYSAGTAAKVNASSFTSAGVSIAAGNDFKATITITKTDFTSGQTIEVALISGSGTSFKRTVVLP